ncbi:MAG: class I SAM-dependent methyltransferase [Proteobacteria bacterium]|nr:MAG: class I SAM-dependent methyltransferase [Pseudomonadota bacterium]
MAKNNDAIVSFNKEAWNSQVRKGNTWTIAVTAEEIQKAKSGDWRLLLTPSRPIPREWFPRDLGAKILGLASGGGQQGPILAAVGYDVTIFDNSPLQLARDREVAEREGLSIRTLEGDMADLSVFEDESFDFIIHPCSNCFVPDVNPVWKEAFRVLKKGGSIISGFTNPVAFTLDVQKDREGIAEMRYPVPYSDLKDLTAEERIRFYGDDEPYTFGHSLEDQVGGQIAAGFHITGFYEDGWPEDKGSIHNFMKVFIATRAIKP